MSAQAPTGEDAGGFHVLGRVIDIVWVLFVIGMLAVLGSDYGELILMLLVVYFLFGS